MPASSVAIPNELGLHARPAMGFVQLAMTFSASVSVRRAGSTETVDGKSIMQMLLLAATKGAVLEISCDGGDADQALAALCAFVASGCGEGG